jgi:hypothetical protein
MSFGREAEVGLLLGVGDGSVWYASIMCGFINDHDLS